MIVLQMLPIAIMIIGGVFLGGTIGGLDGRPQNVELGAILGLFLGCSLSMLYVGLVF